MDTAALARQVAELSRSHEYGARSKLRMAMQENLPAILRALCVMSAMEDGLGAAGTVIADKRCLLAVNARADELLAELSK